MKKYLSLLLTTLVLATPFAGYAQNYKLDTASDLLQTCGYIHHDKFSFNDTLTLIQELLKTKFEGDKACSAPLAQLNSQLVELDGYFNRKITEKEKKNLSKDAQKQYLVDLQSELIQLNPADPLEAARASVVQSLMDTVKMNISTLGVEAQLAELEDQKNADMQINKRWENVYANTNAAISTLNSLPDNCVDKMGGWKNMIPVVMKLASSAGPMVGGVAGGIVSAGFEAGSQIAVLLRNNRIKRAISETNRVQNAQIIACTYSVMQSNACELKRAKDLMDDKKKINDLINQRISDTKNAEYEAYFLQLSRLPRIKSIFKDIGSMGSALTLDLDLLGRYFAAVRLDPDTILDEDIPSMGDPEGKKRNFLIQMKGRGLQFPEYDMNGGPYSTDDQIKNVKTLIVNARTIITTVQSIMTEKRSFFNLKSKLIESNQFVINEMNSLHALTLNYLNSNKIPRQYRADFKTNEIMLRRLKEFLDYEFTGDNDAQYAAYLTEVDVRGRKIFEEMSRGSVAQITGQTVLMIPDIAFERFTRPFKHLEKYFLTLDITLKDDPTHSPYTDFVITRSMQLRFDSYPDFHGTREAFRLETFNGAKNGLEKGFKREIIRMVRSSMEAKSEILTKYEGKTASHMCALFASFLREEAPALFSRCQTEYLSLSLLPILSEANRPTEMKIKYDDPCFYNSYKQEEEGQRRLFEKLIDYGSRNNLVWD
jgi:hypothetical protein